MAITQNTDISTTSWVDLSSSISTGTWTLESTNESFICWTEGNTPSATLRGHALADYVKVSIAGNETLWIRSFDAPYTVVATEYT